MTRGRQFLLVMALVGLVPLSSSAQADGGSTPDAGEEPPLVPPELTQDAPARYPPELSPAPVDGDAKLELLVDETGAVTEATVLEATHPAFGREALHAAVTLRFQPASVAGTPRAVRIHFTYRFQAPERPPPPPEKVTFFGVVRSRGNRRPIAGASVRVEALKVGAETDSRGGFELSLPRGQYSVQVRAPGYVAKTFAEDTRTAERLEVAYALDPLRANPYETVVRGERERTEVSRISLREQEIREVPGTMGDPFRVVMLLPGVSSVVSGVAYPVVRGSSPAATGYFIDGIRVPMLFHLFLGPAVVHPDFLDGIDFYPGAPPARYGRLLGGVVEGRASRPRDDGLHFTAYADLINAGGFVEAPIEATGTSVTLSGRYSYTPWLIGLAANSLQPPPPPGLTNPTVVMDFYDYQARVEQKVGLGRVRLLGFGSSDVVGTRSDDPRVAAGTQAVAFHRVDLRYARPLGGGEWETGLTYGLDRLEMRSQGASEPAFPGSVGAPVGGGLRIDQNTWQLRTGWTGALSPRWSLASGLDVEQKRAAFTQSVLFAAPEPSSISTTTPVAVGTFLGAYAELTYRPSERWTVTPGLRFDLFHLVPRVDRVAVEPRLSVRYALTDRWTLKAAAGLYHQPPTFLINLPVVDVAGLQMGLQEGLQFNAGAEWRPSSDWEVTADVYLNPLLRTLELSPVMDEGSFPSQPVPSDPSQPPNTLLLDPSRGYAYGFELLLRHPLGGNWFGWVSYSLQRSVRWSRYFRYDALGTPYAQVYGPLPFAFDQTHVLNTVVSYQLPNHWTLGVVVHFNTGRPELGGVTSRTMRPGAATGNEPAPFGQGAGVAWYPVDRDQVDRLPPFLRIDGRISKTWVYDTFTLEAYLDFLNVTIAQEVIAFTYRLGGPGETPLVKEPQGLPIAIPILGVKGRY